MPTDPPKRLEFANIMLDRFVDFNNIIFTDEAHFYLEGIVNSQNDRDWQPENPENIESASLHPLHLTAWVGLSAHGLIGPYYYEMDVNGHQTTVTVTAARYGEMITEWMEEDLFNMPGYSQETTWFQQDGAPVHRERGVMETLKRIFLEKLIALGGGNITWPARSPDLSPPDFFLWGYLKGKVYRNKPKTLDELKRNISREMAQIDSGMLHRAVGSFRKRLEELKEVKGGYLKKTIFKQ